MPRALRPAARPRSSSGTSARPSVSWSRLCSVSPCRISTSRISRRTFRAGATPRAPASAATSTSFVRWMRAGCGSPSAATTCSGRPAPGCRSAAEDAASTPSVGRICLQHVDAVDERPDVVRTALRLRACAPTARSSRRESGRPRRRRHRARQPGTSTSYSAKRTSACTAGSARPISSRRIELTPAGSCVDASREEALRHHVLAEEDVHQLAVARRADRQRRGERDLRVRREAFGVGDRQRRAAQRALPEPHQVEMRDVLHLFAARERDAQALDFHASRPLRSREGSIVAR